MATENIAFTPLSGTDFEKLREIVRQDDPKTWDIAWQAKITPWDGGETQPPLREIVESGEITFPRTGRALVPGCGAGYDAIYIASALGLNTLGVDAAETAIRIASNAASDSTLMNAKFEVGDFFKLELPAQFDLIYDYTFFVAIPPSLRPDWGRQMASLVKPGGYLMALVFPIDPHNDSGPPYYVRVEHYAEVLGDKFVKVLDKVPTVSIGSHFGRERMVVWQRST